MCVVAVGGGQCSDYGVDAYVDFVCVIGLVIGRWSGWYVVIALCRVGAGYWCV